MWREVESVASEGFDSSWRRYNMINVMTEEQRAKLTPEERQSLEAAEQEALKMLSRQLREGRRSPRRHQQFVLLVVILLTAIAALVLLIATILGY